MEQLSLTTQHLNPKKTTRKSLKNFELHNRRYIGNKAKLTEWIMQIILQETKACRHFIDLFSGTAVIAQAAMHHFETVTLNDLLHSNHIIYHAFFKKEKWNKQTLLDFKKKYNQLKVHHLDDNYFSSHFGGKFYEAGIAKKIGFIRQDIEQHKNDLTPKEYAILLASLIYTIDRLANTVGHFDAYIKKPIAAKPLNFRLIQPIDFSGATIFRQDANVLAKKISGDIAYIDPPYNSRQYNRFYHIYENLVQWKKPPLFGVALKPAPENSSNYCTVKAADSFRELVNTMQATYLVVSYNNTYQSKSKSSANKISLETLEAILNNVGKTKRFERPYKYFNTGKTEFTDHKELLFVTKKFKS